MATPQAQTIYKERAATAKLINAQCRNRRLQQFPVRGLVKVKMIALWYALAHNLLRAVALLARRPPRTNRVTKREIWG